MKMSCGMLKKLVLAIACAGAVAVGVVALELRASPQKRRAVSTPHADMRAKKRSVVRRDGEGARQSTVARAANVESARTNRLEPAAVRAATALIDELEDGVDQENFDSVVRTVAKMRAIQREKGESAVPAEVREEAVGALANFLPRSLPELVAFWGDPDADVVNDAKREFEFLIDGAAMGDRRLSEVLTTVTRAIDDDDTLDSVFMCIENDMRNSVAVKTYLEILKTGSEAAKARVWESVGDFTCEENISDERQLTEWLRENPDDEDDDELYGPDKDEDGTC